MYCRNCGKEIDGNSEFCTHCGDRVHEPGKATEAGASLEESAGKKAEHSKYGKAKLINKVALTGLVLCVLGLALQSLSKYTSILLMVSFFFGLSSFLQIKKGNGTGAWMAWFAMVLGGINIVVFLSSFLAAFYR